MFKLAGNVLTNDVCEGVYDLNILNYFQGVDTYIYIYIYIYAQILPSIAEFAMNIRVGMHVCVLSSVFV